MEEYKGPKGSGMTLVEVDATKTIPEIQDFIWNKVNSIIFHSDN